MGANRRRYSRRPFSSTMCGLSGSSLSVTTMVALLAPAEVGWKVTLIEQLDLAASDAPQVPPV